MRFHPAYVLKLSFLAAALPCISCSFLAAHIAKQNPGNAARILPPATEISSPFDLDAPNSERVNSIEFRSESAMAVPDREAAGDAMAAIAAKSAVQGFDLSQDKWSYRQIVCPVLPQHVLLLFERNNGAGDLSMFSAAIRRGGEGSVLILPIMRRGYLPYTAAPANPMTIKAFNDIRAQEQTGKKVDWLTTGLCYAALAGNQVALSQSTGNAQKNAFTLESHPLLAIGDDGTTVVRFMDVALNQQPKAWELTFDKGGMLRTVVDSILPIPKVTLIQ
jgi:hypothetical protein